MLKVKEAAIEAKNQDYGNMTHFWWDWIIVTTDYQWFGDSCETEQIAINEMNSKLEEIFTEDLRREMENNAIERDLQC